MAGMSTVDLLRLNQARREQEQARQYAQTMAGTQNAAQQPAAAQTAQQPAQTQAAGQDYNLAQTPGQARQAAPSQAVADAQAYLSGQVSGQQSGAGPYGSDVESLYHAIMDRPKFSYDVNRDPLFQNYKNQYMVNGQRAMQDVMGQSAALTGGYGNSWGNTAGFQAYQYYLQQLNDRIPELEQQAYERYQDEGDELRDNYNLALQFEQYQNALRAAGSGGGSGGSAKKARDWEVQDWSPFRKDPNLLYPYLPNANPLLVTRDPDTGLPIASKGLTEEEAEAMAQGLRNAYANSIQNADTSKTVSAADEKGRKVTLNADWDRQKTMVKQTPNTRKNMALTDTKAKQDALDELLENNKKK